MWALIDQAVKASGAIEQAVLYLLAIFAVASWWVILKKVLVLRRARRRNAKFLTLFNACDTAGEFEPPAICSKAPFAAIFFAAIETLEKTAHSGVRPVPLTPRKLHEKALLRMQHTSRSHLNFLRRGHGFLASVGSSSPFIGLFGTVWGIMATFHALGDAKAASLAMVAPGIASALIATAAGLAVAIPAVMACNWMQGSIDMLQDDAEMFIERLDFMTRAERGGPDGSRGAFVDDEPVVASIDR